MTKIKSNTKVGMKKGDEIKVTGGNNEKGQPTMIGKIGTIDSFGTKYVVKGKKTREVYVDFGLGGLHVFNDYHLELVKELK